MRAFEEHLETRPFCNMQKNPFAKKKKVLKVFLSRRSCIFLTQEVEREGVKGEKTKSCHVET